MGWKLWPNKSSQSLPELWLLLTTASRWTPTTCTCCTTPDCSSSGCNRTTCRRRRRRRTGSLHNSLTLAFWDWELFTARDKWGPSNRHSYFTHKNGNSPFFHLEWLDFSWVDEDFVELFWKTEVDLKPNYVWKCVSSFFPSFLVLVFPSD